MEVAPGKFVSECCVCEKQIDAFLVENKSCGHIYCGKCAIYLGGLCIKCGVITKVPEKKIEFFIKQIRSDQTISFHLSNNTTIGEIKEILKKEYHQNDRIMLVHKGLPLNERKTLAECLVDNMTTIFLV